MACAGAVCMNVGVTVIASPLECSRLFYMIVVCANSQSPQLQHNREWTHHLNWILKLTIITCCLAFRYLWPIGGDIMHNKETFEQGFGCLQSDRLKKWVQNCVRYDYQALQQSSVYQWVPQSQQTDGWSLENIQNKSGPRINPRGTLLFIHKEGDQYEFNMRPTK